jgi:hypothetical protein
MPEPRTRIVESKDAYGLHLIEFLEQIAGKSNMIFAY